MAYTDGNRQVPPFKRWRGNSCNYAPRGDVEHQVTLEQYGDSIANDVAWLMRPYHQTEDKTTHSLNGQIAIAANPVILATYKAITTEVCH
ncbi:hypothetical protein O9993_16640 [Vibrio lentus]|nr:hypothetical protein [Vibrio lentus]